MQESDEGYAEKAAEVASLQTQFDAEKAKAVEATNYVDAQIAVKNEDGKTRAQQWITQVYKDFYASVGLTEGDTCPVYVAEYAYVDYQKANNLALNNIFYYILFKKSSIF